MKTINFYQYLVLIVNIDKYISFKLFERFYKNRRLFIYLGHFGDTLIVTFIILILISIGFFYHHNLMKIASFFLYFVFWQAILTLWIKSLICRIRPPYLQIKNYCSLIPADIYSFPSAHAARFAMLTTIGFFYNSILGISLLIISGLIGFARVIVGVHYFGDVLAGYFLGWGSTMLLLPFDLLPV